jgi:uncharacterized membrane protein YkvA (DUF1232 family)
MKPTLESLIAVKGLSDLTMGELCQGLPVREAVLRKCDLLNRTQFRDQLVEKHVRVMVDMVRSVLSGQYPQVSVLAFADVLAALDYFLRLHDRIPDTEVGGFHDDCDVILKVVDKFQSEFRRFEKWQIRQSN